MGAMGAFFSSVFSGLFSLVATYLGKKVTNGAIISMALVGISTAFYVGINTLLNSVMVLIPNQVLLMVFHSLLPSNFTTCLTAVLTTDLAAFIYSHQLLTIKAVTSAN